MVGEDALCGAFGERLVEFLLPNWTLAQTPILTGGITRLIPSLPRYIEQARYVQPVICIADTDGKCPARLIRKWLPNRQEPKFLFRLAVHEAESWLLADPPTFAEFFGVSANSIPGNPDELADPKREVLLLARRSKLRQIRSEVVSVTACEKPGTGYNLHLCRYIRERWRVQQAISSSPSLARAASRISMLGSVV